jgi:5-methylcytosine-specific restriction enzyme subunit McrC
MRLLTLREYQASLPVDLTAQELSDLRRLAPSVDVTPMFDGSDHVTLTPGSVVGTVSLGTLAIEIRPKLPIDRLLFLLSYTMERANWRDVPFDYGERRSLLEAIVPGFVAQARRALARGVLQGYRVEEEALPTIRGRLRFDDQLRKRHGRFLPAEVRFDEYTEDIEENRLLKAAIARLGRLRLRSESSRRALRAFDETLSAVRLIEYDPRRLPEISWTRLNSRYRSAVELARLILRATSFDLAHGGVRSSAFVVDMNELFEDFVVTALREEFGVSASVFPQGARSRALRLDRGGRITLKPDISWWDGSACRFVGDVKYKRVNAAGIQHPDLYQLLAYTVAANLPGGLLIYAAGEGEPARHEVVHLSRQLEVMALDLDGSPDEVLAQIAIVARRIHELRAEAISRAEKRIRLSSSLLSEEWIA